MTVQYRQSPIGTTNEHHIIFWLALIRSLVQRIEADAESKAWAKAQRISEGQARSYNDQHSRRC